MILQKLDLQKILLWCCQTTCPTNQDCKNTGGLKKCKPKNLGLKKKPWFKPIVWTMQHYHKRTTLVSSAVVSYCILCNSMPYFYDILQYFLWQYMTYYFLWLTAIQYMRLPELEKTQGVIGDVCWAENVYL